MFDAGDAGEAGEASDAAADVDADVVDPSVCAVPLQAYCYVNPCPMNEDAAIAQLCAKNTVVSVCGNIVESVMIDTGSGYVFENGKLTTVFSFDNATTTCIAGAIGSNVSNIGCAFTTNACLTDAGDAGDASDQ
jgi:hypothetical protein